MINSLVDILPVSLFVLTFFSLHKKENVETGISINNSKSIKAVATLIIVLHHLSQHCESGFILQTFQKVGDYATSLFFFLSGYGLIKKRRNNENYENSFLRKRLYRIFLAYIFSNLIVWLINFLKGNYIRLETILGEMKIGWPFVPHSWYIICIILFYFVFYIEMKILKDKFNWYIFTNCIFIFAYICIMKYILHFDSWWYITSPFFVVGMIVSNDEKKIKKIITDNWLKLLLVDIVLLIIFVCGYQKAFIDSKLINSFLKNITVIIAIYLINMKYEIKNTAFNFINVISLEIYLYHGAIYEFLRSGLIYINNDLLWCCMTIVLTICISYLVKLIFDKLYKC